MNLYKIIEIIIKVLFSIKNLNKIWPGLWCSWLNNKLNKSYRKLNLSFVLFLLLSSSLLSIEDNIFLPSLYSKQYFINKYPTFMKIKLSFFQSKLINPPSLNPLG